MSGLSVVHGTRTDVYDVTLQFDVEYGSVGRDVSERTVAHDRNDRGTGGKAHALVRPNTGGCRRIEAEVAVMVGRAGNQVPHRNGEITLGVSCRIYAGPGIGIGPAIAGSVIYVDRHNGTTVFLNLSFDVGPGGGHAGRSLGLDDRRLGLDQEGHDQGRGIVVVQATQQGTVGVFENQVDRCSGCHARGTRDDPRGRIDGQTVWQSESRETGWRTGRHHGVSVSILGERLVRQATGKHRRTGRGTERPKIIGG